jgi:hypothetical protein
LASEPFGETLRKRKPQIRPPLLDPGEPRSGHRGFKPAADGFDFGQFWHLLASVFWTMTGAPQLLCRSTEIEENPQARRGLGAV